MRRVVVDMQNVLFSDAIARTLQEDGKDFSVYISEHPSRTTQLCADSEADVLIMEVTAYAPWRMEERMRIREAAKNHNQTLKIVLLVDETTEKALADQVRQVKKDGIIDSFIYGSVSSAYLSAIVDTL